MCTHTRQRSSPSASAEMASSKSRALAGSIVNVASERRSRRPPWPRRSGARRPRACLALHRGVEGTVAARGRPSVPRSRRGPLRAPQPARDPAPAPRRGRCAPRRARTTTRSPTAARESLETAMRGPGPKNGSATRNFPRRSITATRGEPTPRRAGRARRGRAHRSSAATTRSATASAWSPGARGIVGGVHVGRDPAPSSHPAAAEVLPVGGEVLADRDVERPAVGERHDLLEDALAVGVGSDDLGPAAVLQRPGDDLGRRRGVAVHQHHHRDPGRDRVPLGEVHLARLAAPGGRDDRAVGDEDAGHVDRLVKQTAAVLAQIEDQRPGPGAERPLDVAPQLVAGAVGERGQLQVTRSSSRGS